MSTCGVHRTQMPYCPGCDRMTALNAARAEAVLAFAAWLIGQDTCVEDWMAEKFITAQGWPLPKE